MKQQSTRSKSASRAARSAKGSAEAKATRKPASARRVAAKTPAKGASKAASSKKATPAKSAARPRPATRRPAPARTGAAKPKAAAERTRPSAKPRRPAARPKAKSKARARKAKLAPKLTTDAAFRLSRDVRPSHYHVHILPDLVRSTFRGEVVIELDLKRQRQTIELHAADITIDHAEIAPRDAKAKPPQPKVHVPGAKPVGPPINQVAVAIVPHGARETVEVKFLRPVGPGKYALSLAYHGNLQERLRGLYVARVGDERYAFTQLEAADARRFFPCFDEPDMKARFTFSVTARAGLTVISNNPLERSTHNTNGTTTFHFKTTPPLSTYLCALAVGELEGSAVRMAGKCPVRVWHVPGKRHLTGFALEAAVESLARLEKYFGLPYPYEKLDLVAVPDFEAGAMENAGAVFFRETLLLVDPATISLAEKKRVAEVIAHELAHMWFGNLVTMKWWDDLWLNEAFATWMAFKVVDEWKPEWRMWNNFEQHRAAALALDALANTHPVYAEVENAAQATENFDAITYEKGASVVRMIEHYLGPQKFRAGVQAYIRDHREGNAVAADLWNALERASGQPVAQIVRAWVRQAGFPLVSFERDPDPKRAQLVVKQERFRASPMTKFPEGAKTWPLPAVVKFAGTAARPPRTERFLLRRAKERIPVPGGKHVPWYYGNAGEGGFYRVLHDADCLAELARDLSGALTPVERMGLLGHQWAIVRAGRARIGSFLDLASALGAETDYEVLDSLVAPLAFVDDQIVDAAGADARPHYQAWIREVFGQAWQELGWEPAPTDDDERKLRRASVLRILGLVGEEPSIAGQAPELFERYLANRTAIEPNLVDPLIAIVARDGDEARFARLRRAVAEARTPQESRRFQLALGDFRNPTLAQRAAEMTLTPEIPTQDVGFLLIRLLGNRAARELAWKFIQENWAALAKRLPPMMVSRVIEATASLQTREYRKQVAMFFRTHPVETATRALKLALERFDINEELRRRAGKELRAWFAARGVALAAPTEASGASRGVSPGASAGASPETAHAPGGDAQGTDAPVVG